MKFWSCRYQMGTQHEDTGGNCSNNASSLVLAHTAIQSNHLWLGGPQLMASVTSCHHTIDTMGCVLATWTGPKRQGWGCLLHANMLFNLLAFLNKVCWEFEKQQRLYIFLQLTLSPSRQFHWSCWVNVSKRGEQQVDNTVYNLWSQPFHHQGLHSMLSSVQNTTGNRVMVRRPSSWQNISSPILAFPWSFNTLANTSRKYTTNFMPHKLLLAYRLHALQYLNFKDSENVNTESDHNTTVIVCILNSTNMH